MDPSPSTSGGERPPKKKAKKNAKLVEKLKGVGEQVSSTCDTSMPFSKIPTGGEEFDSCEISMNEKTEEMNVSCANNTNIQEFAVQIKLDDYSHNDLIGIVIDEVSLEGLDGITIEALWTRLSERTPNTSFSNEFQNTVWEILTKADKIKFNLLPEKRPKLVIYNRFKYLDWDTGHLTEPDEVPQDIYPFAPISDEDSQNQCFGSCADFKARVNISEEIRQMTLTEANNKYGSKLVIVADQIFRNKALGLENAKSLDKLLNVHYCMLERIGRARQLGEVTTGKNSLQQMSHSKTLFYLRKTLLTNGLITKQFFFIKSQKGNTSGLLFHLPRFYRPYKPMKLVLIEQIVDILKKKPDHRIEYLELKKLVGYDVWVIGVQKLLKSPEFRQYVQTDVIVPYRTMYPNATQKEWKVRSGAKEKNLRILQLIDPTVHLPAYSKEEDVKDESSDDEPIGEYAYNESVFNQTFKLVSESGTEGISLRQIQLKLGLDFYATRSVLTNMVKRNLIETKNADIGRVHILKYYVPTVNEGISLKSIKREAPSTSKDETDDDTLSFIADILEVNKDDLIAKEQESSPEDELEVEFVDPFKGHFDFIREYRTKNRLERYAKKSKIRLERDDDEKSPDEKKIQAEEREKYEAIFKNDHNYYPMELSLQYKKIEPWKLDIKVDDGFADVLRTVSSSEKKASIRSIDYDHVDASEYYPLDIPHLIKLTTSPKSFRLNTLLGSTEKASKIVTNYLFLPINKSVEALMKRFQSILQDIRTKSLNNEIEFPDDLFSDEEIDINNEGKDNVSIEVHVEEGEQDVESTVRATNEEEDEVKCFKSHLLKNFEDSNCLLALANEKWPLIERADIINDAKRKNVEIEENPTKRMRLDSKAEEDRKIEDKEQSVHIAQDPAVILKNITDIVKMEIYMGDDPILLSHCLDEDNIQTTIICTKNVEARPQSEKYINKSLSQRAMSRANFILETVYREKVISDIPKLIRTIKTIESEKKFIGLVDRKSIARLLCKLTVAGYIKIFKIILKYENVIRCKNIVCLASVDATYTLQLFIDQLKIAFFIYAKKKTFSSKDDLSAIASEVISPPVDSYDEIVALTSNQKRPQYKHSRVIARQYGYVPKFAKIKVMHELLFYLIYNYDGKAVDAQDVPLVFRQFHVKLNKDSMEDLGTLYKRELSWKMFLPPLPKYKEWPGGWALICDIILRLPLSIFVKIFNVAYIIPDLLSLVNDPIRKHTLLKNVPAHIRNACLHNRKCIFSIHEILCHLCYMGLLQFGVQKLKEKEQQFIYLNRRAILYDTTSSEPGYHEVTPKEYPVLQFYFENQSMVDNYWSKIWTIGMGTKLGQRSSLLEKTITLQDIHTKPEMMQSVMPKSPGGALDADVGYIPGDHRGACCFDSSSWVHVKRNWVWSNSIRRAIRNEVPATAAVLGMRRKHLEQVKFKAIKYKDIPRELNKKKNRKSTSQPEPRPETKLAVKNSKKHPFTRKIHPRSSGKMKLFKYDDLDTKIRSKMGRSRAMWSDEEDVNILICHFAKMFLMSNSTRKIIPFLVIRDVMHRLCSNKRKKTTSAYSRRLQKLIKAEKGHVNEKYLYLLENDKYLQSIFSKLRTKISKGETVPEAHINISFIYLVSYVANTYKDKFINQQRVLDDGRYFDYLNDKDISKYFNQDSKSTGIIYENPQTIDAIKVEVIKDIVHCSLSWKSETSELPLMLYRAYQHYPDHLLRDAISWMRKEQIIAIKNSGAKHWNVKDGIPMAGKLLHNSFVYSFKQITKYPDHVYPEAYQMFISIYKSHNIEREFVVDKYEQGHGLGLSEIVCLHDVIFSFKIPDDMLVLDPKIKDHSQLIQELAVRYKFLLQQRTNLQEGDEQEQRSASGASDNVKDVEKAIEVIFESQKQISCEQTKSKLVESGEDDIHLTTSGIPSTSKETKAEAEFAHKTIEAEPVTQEQIEFESSDAKNEATLEALQHLTSYLGTKQDDNTVKVSDLAYLLTKGLFPELDDDEERLEKLNKHFLIMYPSSTFCIPDTLVGKNWAEEVLTNGRTKGDEIQEIIKGECIIKNTSQDEEVSNSLIDIGGDDDDIKLAFVIVSYIKHKGAYGVSTSEVKKEFQFKALNLDLHEIVNVLIKVGMVFRTGVRDIRLVHVTENEMWTIGLDDERPISEINLNSLGVRLKLMPWVRINGTLNQKVLHNWMYVIVSYCLSSPFTTLPALMKRFNILKPVDILSLLEYLQTLGCLRIYAYAQIKPVTLLSTAETYEKRPANILDDFEAIFIETDKMAIIKMGAFRYKGQTDIDIPFEE